MRRQRFGGVVSQALDSFTIDYYDLLQRLAALPGLPRVIINEYYDPLPADPVCPGEPAITAAKSAVLLSRLTTFNTVLADGAASFGFEAVDPSFMGHELCTQQSFVQGLDACCAAAPERGGGDRHRAGRRGGAPESRSRRVRRELPAHPHRDFGVRCWMHTHGVVKPRTAIYMLLAIVATCLSATATLVALT